MIKIQLIVFFISSIIFANAAYSSCDSGMPRNKPDAMYKDYGDGTVMDTKTRRIWQKCSMGQVYSGGTCVGTPTAYTWEQAMAAVNAANDANMYGHSDWAVPNIKELFSLVDMSCYQPSINEIIFPNNPSTGWYWSSTIGSTGANNRRAYIISVDSGGYGPNSKNANFVYLRLVKSSI